MFCALLKPNAMFRVGWAEPDKDSRKVWEVWTIPLNSPWEVSSPDSLQLAVVGVPKINTTLPPLLACPQLLTVLILKCPRQAWLLSQLHLPRHSNFPAQLPPLALAACRVLHCLPMNLVGSHRCSGSGGLFF